MQLTALDRIGNVRFVQEADKGVDYFCAECGTRVRRRDGAMLRSHFYHLRASSHCRQSGKSAAHLQTQLYVQKALPVGEALLEYPFPAIHRIADVYWKSQSIVFEVQCSPISIQEALERCRDYESLGLHIVWILHTRLYNRWKLLPAEAVLIKRNCYFSSIDEIGKGAIFSQNSVIAGLRRVSKESCCWIDLTQPIFIREGDRSVRFAGDAGVSTGQRNVGGSSRCAYLLGQYRMLLCMLAEKLS